MDPGNEVYKDIYSFINTITNYFYKRIKALLASEIVSEMITLFANPANWCLRSCAFDIDGKPCGALSPNAVSWDVYGALCKINHDNNGEDYTQLHLACDLVKEKIIGENFDLEKWNDSFTDVADILALFS